MWKERRPESVERGRESVGQFNNVLGVDGGTISTSKCFRLSVPDRRFGY